MQAGQETRFTSLIGPNFSGKTQYIHDTRAPADAYVGPDTDAYLSGLTETVEDELRLYVGTAPNPPDLVSLVDVLDLSSLLPRHPFTLSGGQKARVALACACLSGESRVFVDSALEQIDRVVVDRFIEALGSLSEREVVIADNRTVELDLAERATETIAFARSPEARIKLMSPPEPSAAASECMPLRFAGVTFHYRSNAQPTLDGIDAEFAPGKVHVIEGDNGSGKTTLGKLAAGILKPTSGSVSKTAVALAFQDPDRQLFHRSAEAELAHGSNERAARALAIVGLQEFSSTHPFDLPFAARKRLSLMAALTMERPWLFVDEPTIGQDDESCDAIARGLKVYAAQGFGVIVTSHSALFKRGLDAKTWRMDDAGLRLIG
jgi:energy-coupling factor transporter ATP-binding protein EcfA2